MGSSEARIYITWNSIHFSVKDIRGGTISFTDTKFISESDHRRYTARTRPERGDILYTKVGSYGRCALIDTDLDFSLYVSVCLIKPKRNVVDPTFLAAVLGSQLVKAQADRRVKGIGVPDLHLDQIAQFQIPIPVLSNSKHFLGKRRF